MTQQIDRSYGHLIACVVTGNPTYIVNNALAVEYYKEIDLFLMDHGFKEVVFDPGADFTRLPDAAIYIGHSRGCARKQFLTPEKQKRFISFGCLDGIMHPVDREWHLQNQSSFGRPDAPTPPPEHYIFTEQQQLAIVEMVNRITGRRIRN
jgi:hypothetical protein